MRLRRLRVILALVMAGLVLVTVVLLSSLAYRSRAAQLRQEAERNAEQQMAVVLEAQLQDRAPEGVPAWLVNALEGSTEPFADTGVEPPLISLIQAAGESPSFDSFRQGGTDWLAYAYPLERGRGYVTVLDLTERDEALATLRWQLIALSLLLVAGAAALGWWIAGWALRPARRAVAVQQSFLADAAHEMRTPLAVIMASSSQALARPRSSEEYVRSLSEIRAAAERASTGVNELLDLARFDSGQVIPRLAPLRLDLLAEEVAASVRADGCELVAQPGDAVVVDADMPLLRQALENVVRNAARRAAHVELVTTADGRDGMVEVRDDGPGFDEATLAHVFDRYRRGDQRGEAGIGLAIVQAIVTSHGGDVTAANGNDGGAIVRLRVPLTRT